MTFKILDIKGTCCACKKESNKGKLFDDGRGEAVFVCQDCMRLIARALASALSSFLGRMIGDMFKC